MKGPGVTNVVDTPIAQPIDRYYGLRVSV